MRILAIYGSSRRNGNSETLTDKVLEGLPCTRIYLAQTNIKPIVDQRHTEAGFTPVDDDYEHILNQMLASDILVFGSPIYWYGMPGQLKTFFDRWSQTLRDKRYQFKAEMAKKEAYVVLTGDDSPRVKGLPLVQQFNYIFDYMGMRFAGHMIGQGNRPGSILQDQRALADAQVLNSALREKVGEN